jgi:phospholipid/cholesterol/gamma-HCH transport system permease protein
LSPRQSYAFTTPPGIALQSTLAWVGRRTLAGVAELGRIATLLGQAAWALVRPAADSPPFRPAFIRELSALLTMGFPLVGLMHVGMGSFLSLQAYFGGTFVDGTGAVVGVGLFRNVAPMMAGLTMAGLIAVRTTSELLGRSWAGLDDDPLWIADRDTAAGPLEQLRHPPEPARLAAVRIAAALVAGPVMALWGAMVGIVVGWQVAQKMLGVSTHGFFSMMWEMLWLRDVTGLVVKGVLYALLPALFACHEGLRRTPEEPVTNPDVVARAVFRAVCMAAVGILLINSSWFLLVYHAGPAFGPTLLAPKGA